MVTALMSATRHSNRKKTRIKTTSTKPMSIARPRLLTEVSMNVAGRKISVSTCALHRRPELGQGVLDPG